MSKAVIVPAKLKYNLLAPHKDKWVALSADYKKVLASGTQLKSVRQKVARQNIKKEPRYMLVTALDKSYAPQCV